MSKHARLSPSNHRWVNCPRSVREEANYPDIPGEAAIDGTGSHLLLEQCLIFEEEIGYYLGTIIGVNHEDKPQGWLIKKDRIERVEMALHYIKRRTEELKSEFEGCEVCVISESSSNPGEHFGRTDWYGTCDITLKVRDIQGNTFFVEVIDYKDGVSWVDVNNNSQLLSYLFGKIGIRSGKSLPCRMTIIQPKSKTPVRYVDTNSEEVEKKAVRLLASAIKTDDPEAPLIPDDKNGKGYCGWCKHKKNCEALRTVKEKGVGMLEDIKGDIKDKSNEELSSLLDQKPILMAKFTEIEEEIQSRIEAGQNVKGYAMLPGNSTQEWKISEEELVKKLRAVKLTKDEMYISKILSPAQVLKHSKLTSHQKKRFESEFIEKVPGKSSLKQLKVKETDKVLDIFASVSVDSVVQCNTEISFI